MIKKKYLVCYDVTDNRTRTKIEKLLKNYGVRLQYSIFECNVTKDIFTTKISIALMKIINKEKFDKQSDSILIYDVCEKCDSKVKSIGVDKRHLSDYKVI